MRILLQHNRVVFNGGEHDRSAAVVATAAPPSDPCSLHSMLREPVAVYD